jgi:cell fate regulator YaaT (PSP1 superfamily)
LTLSEAVGTIQSVGACTGCSLGTSVNPGGNYVGVRLADAEDGKTTLVFAGEVQVKKGERLIVESEAGPEFAEVTTTTPVLGKACSSKKAKRLLRLASDSEYADYIERVDLQKEVQLFAEGWIEEHRLELRLAKAQVGFDRRKIGLLFTADKKVETRDLCRAVAERFETRVDARMIGVRDETKLLGGIGSCGLTLCCSTWLKGFHPVAIKMAKMQGITPNPSKLTGHCGRLKCCVAYELEGGIEAARRLGHGGDRRGSPAPAPPPAPAAPPPPPAAPAAS